MRTTRRVWLAVAAVLIFILLYRFGSRPQRYEGSELLRVAIRAAVLGGAAVKEGPGHQASKGRTHEGADDPVTDADLRSHCAMVGEITAALPWVMLVSEESGSNPECKSGPSTYQIDETTLPDFPNDHIYDANDVTIWIDPLDATQEYTEKLYDYVTTMVCVAIRGVPTIGVIHEPFARRTTWAWLSTAVSDDLKDVGKEVQHAGHNLAVIVSRSHKGRVESFATEAFDEKIDIISAGGAGYKVLEVVRGRADLYIHTTLIKKWDICAGNAILNTLGGKMTTLSNATIDYSYSSPAANTGGLLATLVNHDRFVEKFRRIKT